MSGVIHKVKDSLTGHHEPHGTNHGPHSSKLANKLDPRVDSDRGKSSQHMASINTNMIPPDTRAAPTTTTGYSGQTVHTSTHGPQTAHTGTPGPHQSNLANKLDPRVDSDRDNRARHQAMGGAHGPHDSSLANKADPRVDSDRDNRAHHPTMGGAHGPHGSTLAGGSAYNTGYGTGTGVGTGGASAGSHVTHGQTSGLGNQYGSNGGAGATTVTPHSSHLANRLDPRVDSDYGHVAAAPAGSSYTTPGTTSSIGGPHNSKVANKLDPRVDSDLDHRQHF
ncbi:hypothetical protein BDW42DRAFT_115654 [Aspergillus taichungensis]|uniref:Cell surface protein n=1 Tax=Aspergillus taichungensis TaxID=482145 RepID=A0A2J5HSN7_9EURO|nr:hypothetical protein BDW42DRAFT_115654 [Aspergillus taichungensis]